MKSGVELIAKERKRQIEEEKWSAKHDATHKNNELAWAAICYAMPSEEIEIGDNKDVINSIRVFIKRYWFWPWEPRWWSPSNDRVRELVKAGALIAAEIDRLQSSNIKELK